MIGNNEGEVKKVSKPPKVKREHKKGEGRQQPKKESVVEAVIVKVIDDLCESVKRPLLNDGEPSVDDMKKPLLSDVQQ